MPDDDTTMKLIEQLFAGATLWGIEADTTYRVVASTLEPAADNRALIDELRGTNHEPNSAHTGENVSDPRIQVLVHPVAEILGSLRRRDEGSLEILTFDVEQLVDVSAALSGARPAPPIFGRPEPRPGQWAPCLSLEGRSSAPDGRRRTLTFEVVHDDLEFDLFVRFDEIELRDAGGATITSC